MLIRILDIPLEGRAVSDKVGADWIDEALARAGRGIVGEDGAFEARVERVGDKILVQGRADLPASLRCARCLNAFEVELGFDITHILEAKPEDDSEEEVELDDGDLDVSYIDGPEFDISDVVREHMHLALPMNPLCKDECAGLCDQCGGNLNEGDCGCKAPVDPRWSGLAEVKLS
jgi:uncharacterized protein